METLIKHNANVNLQSVDGFTALYMAAQNNDIRIIQYLLIYGADRSLATNDGFTPLVVAQQQGHTEAVDLLKN